MSQIEFVGEGSVARLSDVLSELRPRRIFLVTGRESYAASGAREAVEPLLSGQVVERFCEFALNPQLPDVERGIAAMLAFRPDSIVGVGGGSAMDMAKLIRALAPHPDELPSCIEDSKNIRRRGLPLVAIPTTSGSGSEATRFAVVYVGKTKESLDHDWVVPDYALVDPDLTRCLSPRQTAISGLDALAQATESFWSVLSNEESQTYAARALTLAAENLVAAVRAPTGAARLAMAESAHLAGKAISISKTTACHAVSYPMTSYFNVPHGLAAALTLPAMCRFNAGVTESDCLDLRGVAWARANLEKLAALLGAASVEAAAERLRRIVDDTGVPARLGALGIGPRDIPLLLEHGFNPARVKNNPRLLTVEALRAILTELL